MTGEPTNLYRNSLSYAPRAMRAERAAAYLDIGRSKFHQLVAQGALPRPVRIGGIPTWDRLELDAAYEGMKEQDSERQNPIEAHYGIGQ
jgi:predicted DNA-binding transcriptional regulator AlpA